MSEFDKSKPYHIVYGHPGAAFEQDGILYDAAGNKTPRDEVVQEPESTLVAAPPDKEYFETGETDWKEFPKSPEVPEVVVDKKQEETLPTFTPPLVDEEKAKRSAAASERMKAAWALRKAKDGHVE
jgi:hypothetical protein